jgi:hypothetical protein
MYISGASIPPYVVSMIVIVDMNGYNLYGFFYDIGIHQCHQLHGGKYLHSMEVIAF